MADHHTSHMSHSRHTGRTQRRPNLTSGTPDLVFSFSRAEPKHGGLTSARGASAGRVGGVRAAWWRRRVTAVVVEAGVAGAIGQLSVKATFTA
jgi:hypothetical protein